MFVLNQPHRAAAALALGLVLTLTLQTPGRADVPPPLPPAADAAWKPLADEYADVLRAEALAAMAHKIDPRKYPLPAPTAFQKSVVGMVDKLSPDARKKALARAEKQLTTKFTRLPGVSAVGREAVPAQYGRLVAGRKTAVSKAMLDGLAGGDFAKEIQVRKGAAPQPKPPANAVNTLRLELVEFWVVNDTTGWGKDEVRLGGVAVRTNGTTGKVNSFALGSFKDGQKRVYTNKPVKLADFNLNLTSKYPKQGAFILSVAEADWGGTHQDAIDAIGDFLKDKLDKELDKLADDLGKAVADLMKSSEFGDLLGDAVGNVFEKVIQTVFGWLKDFFEDDVFTPIRISFKVTKPEVWANGATHGQTHQYAVKGHGGHYRFKVRWAKVN